MPTDHILSLLLQERERLNRAIEALNGTTKRLGRPPKNPGGIPTVAAIAAPIKKRKPFSAAVRKRMALAQKKRWAA